MATAATISAKLTLDSSDYNTKLNQAKDDTAGFSKALKNVGSAVTNTGVKLTAGLTVPIAAAGFAAVTAASDFEESANAVNVVFGEAAETIAEFGETSAEAVGLSTAEFSQLAAQGGALLQNLGLDANEAAQEQINLTERAADLASIFNTDVSTALEAVQSGLKGEFNPLEQFGVKMNAAAIEAKALELGLADSASELDDNAKATAALALFYEQTEAIAGDFANTSDGLANSQRIAKAEFANLAAEFGMVLLPIITQGVELFRQLAAKFSALTPGQKTMVVGVLAIIAVVGPLLIVLGTLIGALGTIGSVLGAIGAPILIIVGLIALLALAWANNWGGIREKVAAVWAALQPVFEEIKAWLAVAIPIALQFLSDIWTNVLLPAINAVWNFIKTYLFPLFIAVGKFITAVLVVAIRVLWGVFKNKILPVIEEVWSWLSEKLQPVFETFSAWITDKVVPALESLGEWFTKIIGWISDMADGLMNIDLPEWMTPGSPTPWEIGLRGIGKEMNKLNKTSLPGLESNLDMQGAPVAAMGGGGGGNNINIVINADAGTDIRAIRKQANLGVREALRAAGKA